MTAARADSAASTPMGVDIDVFAGSDPVLAIAEEVFAAMVDGEPGYLRPWYGDLPAASDPMYAWVDVQGAMPGRVLVTAERETAEEITRALLAMGPEEVVSDADYVDALGEVANVVGGNVKALVPEAGTLTIPEVGRERPATAPDALLHALPLDWRGRLVDISLWRLP